MTKNEECESLDSSEKDPVSSIIKNMETIKVFRGHSIITLSQNDQNLGPSLTCLHFFDFGKLLHLPQTFQTLH